MCQSPVASRCASRQWPVDEPVTSGQSMSQSPVASPEAVARCDGRLVVPTATADCYWRLTPPTADRRLVPLTGYWRLVPPTGYWRLAPLFLWVYAPPRKAVPMRTFSLTALVLTALLFSTAAAQDAGSVIASASKAIGVDSLKTVEYSATGSDFALGQAANASLPWPKFI